MSPHLPDNSEPSADDSAPSPGKPGLTPREPSSAPDEPSSLSGATSLPDQSAAPSDDSSLPVEPASQPDDSASPLDEGRLPGGPSPRSEEASPPDCASSDTPEQTQVGPDDAFARPEDFIPPPYFPLLAGIFEGGLAVVALGLGWLVGEQPLETLRLDPGAAAMGLGALIPPLGLFWVCLKLRWDPLRRIMQIMDNVVVPLFRTCRLGELAIIAALAGLGEELLFRGVIQAAAAGLFEGLPGVVFGLLLAAMLFGAAHAITRTYAVLAALIGLYLGIVWLATGNLLVPIMAHAGYDFLVLVYLVRFRGPARERPET